MQAFKYRAAKISQCWPKGWGPLFFDSHSSPTTSKQGLGPPLFPNFQSRLAGEWLSPGVLHRSQAKWNSRLGTPLYSPPPPPPPSRAGCLPHRWLPKADSFWHLFPTLAGEEGTQQIGEHPPSVPCL